MKHHQRIFLARINEVCIGSDCAVDGFGSQETYSRLHHVPGQRYVFSQVMDYLHPSTGGDWAGSKHPGSGCVGLCSRDRFKQLIRGLWRTHFTDDEADALAARFKPVGEPHPAQASDQHGRGVKQPPIMRCTYKARNKSRSGGGVPKVQGPLNVRIVSSTAINS